MPLISLILHALQRKPKVPVVRNPSKSIYKHYGQRPNPDAKRHQKAGPRKD